ncbi:unnamed protein product [Camellia sinensis]
MARPTLQLLLLALYVLYISSTGESTTLANIVKARTALTTSLAAAGSIKANMLKLKTLKGLKATDSEVLKDCLGHVDESVDKLSQSVREIKFLGQVNGDKFVFHKGNVQTWTSAALTEIDDCEEGLSSKAIDSKIKGSIQGQGSVWPLSFLVRYCGMLRNRMLADPNFLFKVGTEVAIDSGCTTFAEFQKRGKDFWAEFELYTADLLVGMVVDIALVSMLAPYTRIGKPSTSSGFFGRFNRACGALPSSVFEAERPGCKFSMKQRIATYFYKCESAALENIVKARTALSTSLATTGSVKANMLMLKNLKGLKATDYRVLKDCLGHVEESVDKLSQSVRELKFLGQVQGDKFFPHQSHVQTWTSTALTELNDCEEGLSGKNLDGKIKDSIRGQITNAKKQISNALATINQLAQ